MINSLISFMLFDESYKSIFQLFLHNLLPGTKRYHSCDWAIFFAAVVYEASIDGFCGSCRRRAYIKKFQYFRAAEVSEWFWEFDSTELLMLIDWFLDGCQIFIGIWPGWTCRQSTKQWNCQNDSEEHFRISQTRNWALLIAFRYLYELSIAFRHSESRK